MNLCISVFLAEFNCLHCSLLYYCNASQHSGSCILFSQLCNFLPEILGVKKCKYLKEKNKMTQQWQTQWSNSILVCCMWHILHKNILMHDEISCTCVILLTAAETNVLQWQLCFCLKCGFRSTSEHPNLGMYPHSISTQSTSHRWEAWVYSVDQHPCALVGC